MGFFYVKGVPGISALLGESNEACMLTTIRGLIVAGDMGLWTSAAVDQLTMSHGEIYWVALYKSVFRMVVEGDHDRTRKFGRPVDGFLERAREEIEMEKRKHAKDLADWNADARRLVDSRLRDASQEPVSGAQEKTHNPEEEDLERRRVPPTRTQLYEISSDNIIPRNTPAPSIASSQPFSSLLTSMRSIFRIPLPPSFGSHEMDSEISSEMKISSNMPENCAFIKTVNLNTIPRPRLVNCVRPIDRRYKSPASIPCATCITETSPGPNKGTSVNPRSNFGRTFSSGTVTNNSTSSSSKLVQTPMRIMHALFGPATCTPDDDYSTSSYDGEVNVPSRSNSKTQDISGLNDLRKAWSIDQKPYVEISREELAALALVLGMQLKINDFTASISGIGGFGTSLTASQAGGYWKVNLVHGSRTLSQRNNRGSGYVGF